MTVLSIIRPARRLPTQQQRDEAELAALSDGYARGYYDLDHVATMAEVVLRDSYGLPAREDHGE